MTKAKKILVVGASGYVGQHIVPKLLAEGHRVWATGRKRTVLEQRPWDHTNPNLRLCPLDLNHDDQETLNRHVADKDIVLFLVHGMSHGDDFVDHELTGALHFQQALKQSSVKQVIYLGALQTTDKALSPHLYARQQTGKILRESGVPTVELQAGIIVGAGSAAFEVMCDFVDHLPLLLLPKGIENHNAPIALENLLYYLQTLVNRPIEQHRIWSISGAEPLSYRQQLQSLKRRLGKKRPMITLPFLSLKLFSPWVIGLTSVPKDIASALISGLDHDLNPDASEIQRHIPQRLLTYEEAIDAALQQQTDLPNPNQWGKHEAPLERWQRGFGYYPKTLSCRISTTASPQQIWQTLNRFGDDQHRHFFGEILWQIRHQLDKWFSKESPSPTQRHFPFAVDDQFEGWQVIQATPERHLGLLFTLKAPGLGRLTFDLKKEDQGATQLTVTAWWHPKGWMGLAYWYAFYPAHAWLFSGMLKRICATAQKH